MFSWAHALNEGAGGFFNGFCKFISFFGKSGWFFILLGFVFLLFARTRREGLAVAIALLIGALITNIILKNAVGRVRPFNRGTEQFNEWWIAAGSNPEDSASFPSGHTTAAFAFGTAFTIIADKRYGWTALLFAFLMAFSRIYLIVHYPTDVLAGIIIGTAAGLTGAALSKLIYKKARGKFKSLLYGLSITALCKKIFAKKKSPQESDTVNCVGDITCDSPADDNSLAANFAESSQENNIKSESETETITEPTESK